MKSNYIFKLFAFLLSLITFNSCAVVGGIFKTGMGVGAIIVIGIIALVVYFISRSAKK